MKKQTKPGDLFNKLQVKKAKHKKASPNFELMQFGDRSIPNKFGGAQGNANSTKMGANPKYFKKKHKKMTLAQDAAYDKKHGIKEGSPKDMATDKAHGVKDKKHRKAMKCKTCGR